MAFDSSLGLIVTGAVAGAVMGTVTGAFPIPFGEQPTYYEANAEGKRNYSATNCAEVIAYELLDRENVNWRKLRVVTAIEMSLQLDDQSAYFELRDQLRAAVPNASLRDGLIEDALSVRAETIEHKLCRIS